MIETAIDNHIESILNAKNAGAQNAIQFASSLSLTIIAMLQFASIFQLA